MNAAGTPMSYGFLALDGLLSRIGYRKHAPLSRFTGRWLSQKTYRRCFQIRRSLQSRRLYGPGKLLIFTSRECQALTGQRPRVFQSTASLQQLAYHSLHDIGLCRNYHFLNRLQETPQIKMAALNRGFKATVSNITLIAISTMKLMSRSFFLT